MDKSWSIGSISSAYQSKEAPDFGSRKHSAAAKKQDALILNKGNVLAERAKVIDGTFNFL